MTGFRDRIYQVTFTSDRPPIRIEAYLYRKDSRYFSFFDTQGAQVARILVKDVGRIEALDKVD